MRHGGEIHRERSGSQVCDGLALSSRARGEYGLLESGDRALSCGLPEWNQPHPGAHEIAHVALQIRRQRQRLRHSETRGAKSQYNRQRRGDGTAVERFMEPIKERVGPNLT